MIILIVPEHKHSAQCRLGHSMSVRRFGSPSNDAGCGGRGWSCGTERLRTHRATPQPRQGWLVGIRSTVSDCAGSPYVNLAVRLVSGLEDGETFVGSSREFSAFRSAAASTWASPVPRR